MIDVVECFEENELLDDFYDGTSTASFNQLLTLCLKPKTLSTMSPGHAASLELSYNSNISSCISTSISNCHQTASRLPSQLHNSGANSTSRWFDLMYQNSLCQTLSLLFQKRHLIWQTLFRILSFPLTSYILILDLVFMRFASFPKLLSWWTSSALVNILLAW